MRHWEIGAYKDDIKLLYHLGLEKNPTHRRRQLVGGLLI